jgi:FkbM family methyltransferase
MLQCNDMGNVYDLVNLAKWANRHPIASKHKIRTLSRFLRWQFSSRLIGQPIVLPYVDETRLIISKQMRGAAVCYYFGLPEVEEAGLALHFLRQGELLGDIGANIGGLTVAAAGVARARVLAMEPVPSTYRALCDNVAVNDLGKLVKTVAAGAGETSGFLRFTTDRGASDRVARNGTGQRVAIQALDAVFSEAPRMLVLDVEGFEPAVVKGASRLLSEPRLQIVIIETLGMAADYGLDDRVMHQQMLGYGFKTVTYDPFRRAVRATEGMNTYNTIYVRDPVEVEQRVKNAKQFRIVDQLI